MSTMPSFMQHLGNYFFTMREDVHNQTSFDPNVQGSINDPILNPISLIVHDINGRSKYSYIDGTVKNFSGVTITSISGFLDIGDPKNILKEEVVNSNRADIYVPYDEGIPNVYTTSKEITINFFVSDFWGGTDLNYGFLNTYSVQNDYENFVRTFIGKPVWINSVPHGRYNRFIGTKGITPVKQRLGNPFGQNIITGKLVLERIYSTDFKIGS